MHQEMGEGIDLGRLWPKPDMSVRRAELKADIFMGGGNWRLAPNNLLPKYGFEAIF
jgi:hypothetical protein